MSNLNYYNGYADRESGYVEWSDWATGTVESERKYEVVGEVVAERPAGDYSPGYVRVVTTLYMDPATGLVVVDIPQYEQWIGSTA